MSRRPSRRGFLTAVGASSLALAGCAGIEGVSIPGNGGGGGNANGTPSGSTPGKTPAEDPYTGGSVVEDFEDLDAWGEIGGSIAADEDHVYTGDQSVRLENAEGGAAGMYKAYPEGLDLSEDNLSIALKLAEPASGKLSVELLAPGRENHLLAQRYVVEHLDEWFRVDLGYTGKTGEPDIENVQELRIMVITDDEPVRFWVDDLRGTPKPDEAKYILSFDDAHASQYDVVFPELRDRGWSGVAAVVRDVIGSDDGLTIGQLREMRSDGWDVASHPQTSRPLTEYSKDEQRSIVEQSKQYLEQKGFPDGSRFFFAPFNEVDVDTLAIVRDLHEYGFTFGACPSAVPPTGRYTISRVLGRDPQGIRRVLNLAEEFRQLVVINWHEIGDDADTTEEDFLDVLDHIEEKDADVITASELLEMDDEAT